MNITSKTISVGTTQVKALYTHEMIQDLKSMGYSFDFIQMEMKMEERGRKIDELLDDKNIS